MELDCDMIRVAIVDDHPIARLGVQSALDQFGGFHIVASAGTAEELLESLAGSDRRPDVVVLDLYHRGRRPCLDAVSLLAPLARVLVMSASGLPADVIGAIHAGGSGYITKQAEPQAFAGAVESVAAGGFWLSSRLADLLQAELSGAEPRRRVEGPVRLSPREEQTLDLIARGLTHAQAATRMGVSTATVNTYVERIRGKLQVGNKAELTRAALSRLGRSSTAAPSRPADGTGGRTREGPAARLFPPGSREGPAARFSSAGSGPCRRDVTA